VNNDFIVTSEEELDTLFGEPHKLVKQKSQSFLDENMMEFIHRSSLICLSTIDNKGQVDVSPKGDAPGFVQIDSETHLTIPDRPGNRLVMGFRNILKNNNVGIIFIAPNMRETLRIKGQAVISRDPSLLQELSAKGKPALLATRITIDECFFHCGKALIRSKLWKPDEWEAHSDSDSLMVRNVASKISGGAEMEKAIEAEVEENYRKELY
jgi:PPOX class probable FMN-dependent enzyme